jgi:hypothetical protein
MSQQTDSHYGSSHEGGCYLSDDEEPLDERSKEFAVEDYAFPRLASGTIASFEDDSDSLMTPPFPEISEHSCQIDEERQDDEEQLNFQDSVGSLNEAFEKLDKCMERTAQSRAMLREKLASQSLSTYSCPAQFIHNESLQGAQIEDWKSFVLQHLEPKLKGEGNK